MRRRLLLSTLAVAIAAILSLGIPLAYASQKLVYEEAEQALERETATILAGSQLRWESHQPITSQQIAHEYPGRYIVIDLPDGGQGTAGDRPQRGKEQLSDTRATGNIRVKMSQNASD